MNNMLKRWISVLVVLSITVMCIWNGETHVPQRDYASSCRNEYVVNMCDSYVMYTKTNSNVRFGPSKAFKVYRTIAANTPVTVIGVVDNGWYMINLDGYELYISNTLLRNGEAQQSVQTVAGTPQPRAGRAPIATNPAPSALEQEYINYIISTVVTPELSDIEVAIKMNDFLCAYAEYDNSYSIYTTLGLLENQRGVCQAYANAYWRLMNAAGIPCDYVSGYALGGSHAWNRVLIDGVYYYVDVTWNDSCYNQYLLLSYEEMSWTHVETQINRYREY